MKKILRLVFCLLFVVPTLMTANPVFARDPNNSEKIWLEPKCAPGFCLDAHCPVVSSGASGAICHIYPFVGHRCQVWVAHSFSATTNGAHYTVWGFANYASPCECQVLDESVDSSHILAWLKHRGDNQRWIIIGAGDGYVYLKNKATGRYLTTNGNSEGSQVWGYKFTGSDNQKWKIH